MDVYLQHKTIESVLKRGENLDNLVDKSNDLSSASQVHYPSASYTMLVEMVLYMLYHWVCWKRGAV